MGQPRIAAAAAAADGRGRDPPGQSLATGAAQRRDRTPAGADRKPHRQSRGIRAPLAACDRAGPGRPQGAVRAGAGDRAARRAGERRRGTAPVRHTRGPIRKPRGEAGVRSGRRAPRRRGSARAGARCAGTARAVLAGRRTGAPENRAAGGPGQSGRRGDERHLPEERADPRAGVSRRARRREHAASRGRRTDGPADFAAES